MDQPSLSGSSKETLKNQKGSPSKGKGPTPTSNKYEILSHGDNIPTTVNNGIPLFNVGSSLEVPILEENPNFVSSPKMDYEIHEKEEDFPHTPFKGSSPIDIDPMQSNIHLEYEPRIDEDKDELAAEGKQQKKVGRKPHKEKREEETEKEKELGHQLTLEKVMRTTRGARNQSGPNHL
jgi:hypothetical protein